MMIRILLVAAVLALAGCSGEPPIPTNPPAPTPLTLEEWKALPVPEKYDEASFERVRMGDPNLQSDRGWHNFMATVVIPERQKDIPGTPGVLPPEAKK